MSARQAAKPTKIIAMSRMLFIFDTSKRISSSPTAEYRLTDLKLRESLSIASTRPLSAVIGFVAILGFYSL
jgi:hypothetical protein